VVSGLENGETIVELPGKMSDLSNEGRKVTPLEPEIREDPLVTQ